METNDSKTWILYSVPVSLQRVLLFIHFAFPHPLISGNKMHSVKGLTTLK